MIRAVIFPIGLEVCDAAQQSAAPPEVGWFVSMPESACTFCRIGCCVQRVVSALGQDAIVIHGVLGEA